jgi:hypothetical protein
LTLKKITQVSNRFSGVKDKKKSLYAGIPIPINPEK